MPGWASLPQIVMLRNRDERRIVMPREPASRLGGVEAHRPARLTQARDRPTRPRPVSKHTGVETHRLRVEANLPGVEAHRVRRCRSKPTVSKQTDQAHRLRGSPAFEINPASLSSCSAFFVKGSCQVVGDQAGSSFSSLAKNRRRRVVVDGVAWRFVAWRGSSGCDTNVDTGVGWRKPGLPTLRAGPEGPIPPLPAGQGRARAGQGQRVRSLPSRQGRAGQNQKGPGLLPALAGRLHKERAGIAPGPCW